MIADNFVDFKVEKARLVLKGWTVLRIAITANDARLCFGDQATDCNKQVSSEYVCMHWIVYRILN